jgi:DMSO/TMAO reductase YedYZ molybdopterin-dependent catalytic subunit
MSIEDGFRQWHLLGHDCAIGGDDKKGGAVNSVRLDPQGPFRRNPLAPHQMRDRLTRTQDAIVLCYLGVPRLELDAWSLTIDGMVERPRTLRFSDLMNYPRTEITSVHQCCGNP